MKHESPSIHTTFLNNQLCSQSVRQRWRRLNLRSACKDLYIKQFPALGHSSTCMPPFFEKAQTTLPLRFRIDVKTEAAEPQDAEKSFSFFFQLFFRPLGKMAKCVRSCLKCIGALTSKSIQRCLRTYCQK